MRDVNHSKGEPHDPVTRLADVAAQAAYMDPEWTEGHRIIVLISTSASGGLTYQGYPEDEMEAAMDATFDMLQHVRALMRAHGRDISIFPMPGQG